MSVSRKSVLTYVGFKKQPFHTMCSYSKLIKRAVVFRHRIAIQLAIIISEFQLEWRIVPGYWLKQHRPR